MNAATDTAKLRLLCAWCGKTMREAEPGSKNASVSHGICGSCAERERANARRTFVEEKQCQSDDYNDAEFLGFAKSYLSEAFPNPQRIGCPSDCDLQRMVEHPVEPRDGAVSEHLTCCSPCFNRYMEILAGLKQRRAEQSA